ncbi:MAG TPA: hypothetical protein VGX50_21650 [Longimicrobium sp.]|jgi:hypothetical protein|nr:hypothetical protein [Longimicrobium sp.]
MMTAARKLASLADELDARRSFPITRLTVLKRLCAEWEHAARFACYLADLSRKHFRTAPPARLDAERAEAFMERINDVIAGIHGYMATPTREADLALRAARRELAGLQSESRDTQWATVRTIHSREALVVENAANCILDPRNSATWGYRLGRDYAERYDPRHGTGLVPESAPLVRDIADFWLHVALPPVGNADGGPMRP